MDLQLVSSSEPLRHLVCPTLHKHVHYLSSEKEKLAGLFLPEKVAIPAYSVFIGRVYVQHVGYGW